MKSNQDLTLEQQITIESYTADAISWADAHNEPRFWGEAFDVYQAMLPSGRVLEVGCGGGRDARDLIQLGYEYVGTDPVDGFIEYAKEQNPTGTFDVKAAEELDYADDSFDGFWASAVLLHIPKSGIDQVTANLNRMTRAGGIGFIAIKEGDEEVVREEVSSDGKPYKRLWTFYQDEEFREILMRNKMIVKQFIYKPMSERTKWLIYIVEVLK